MSRGNDVTHNEPYTLSTKVFISHRGINTFREVLSLKKTTQRSSKVNTTLHSDCGLKTKGETFTVKKYLDMLIQILFCISERS